MKWLVEVTHATGDIDAVNEAISSIGYEVVSKYGLGRPQGLLRHLKYDQCQSASDIHADAISLSEKLRRISETSGHDFTIDVGPVLVYHEDGTIGSHHFLIVSDCIHLHFSTEATLIANPDISEDERQKLAKEAAMKETAVQRREKIHYASIALKNEAILKVRELLRIQQPSMTELGHIVDLVKDASRGDLAAFSTRNELSRFERSINHPEVMGLRARHAVSYQNPPPDPMSIEQAKAFAHRIGTAWIRYVSDGGTIAD